jgi:hypothetical protein
MANSVEVDPAQLKVAALTSESIQQRIQQSLTRLQSTLTSDGTPWGNDSFGKKFAEGDQGYLVASENLTAGLTQMSSTFGDFAKGQREAADGLTAMDQNNQQGFGNP